MGFWRTGGLLGRYLALGSSVNTFVSQFSPRQRGGSVGTSRMLTSCPGRRGHAVVEGSMGS